MLKKWLFVFMVFSAFAACKDFLQEDPSSLLEPGEFFQTEADAQFAVDAIYSHINTRESVYANYYWLVNALASDVGSVQRFEPDLAEFSNFNISPQNQVVEDLWKGLFGGIYTANYAINNLEKAPINETVLRQLTAEARFFRAMFYFDLVRFFGRLPIITDAPTSFEVVFEKQSRQPVDSVYAFILEDLNYASENLPEASDPGRPNVNTSIIWIAKVLLTNDTYGTTRALKTIINSMLKILNTSSLALYDDYREVFLIANNNGQETVFSANFDQSISSPVNTYLLPDEFNGNAAYLPTASLLSLFDSLDRRRNVTFIESYLDEDSNRIELEPHIAKYWDREAEPSGGPTANDLPLCRFGEVYLIAAEAINEAFDGPNQQALDAMNAIRERARFDGDTIQDVLPDLEIMDYDAFNDAILEERARELAFEGHRWFDLVRFDKLVERVQAAKPEAQVEEKHRLLPIPQSELLTNPGWAQNPGY